MQDQQITSNPLQTAENDTSSKVPLLGSLCLAASAVIVALILVEGSGSRLQFMPRSWYTNRQLWTLIAVGGFVAAFFLLRSKPASGDERSPRRTAPAFGRVVLYTRVGCHLCDDAHELLVNHGLAPVLVDIDCDPALQEKWNACVPVVEIDGKIRFRGRVDPVLLRRLLATGGNP